MTKDLRVIKTKKSLRNALISLLQEKSLDQISVAELCRDSGITRRTFYLHYKNIPDYFGEIVEGLLDELEQSMKRTTDHRVNTNEHWHPKMIYLFEHVYENKEFYRFIFNRNSHFAYYELFFKRMKSMVEQSIESMDLENEISDFEVSYQANALLGIIMAWYDEDFERSVEEMNEILVKALRV